MKSNIARHVIDKCGGVAVVAELTGVHSSRVHRWKYEKNRGGTGGLIPSRHHQRLIDGARAMGIDLEPADFFQTFCSPVDTTAADDEAA